MGDISGTWLCQTLVFFIASFVQSPYLKTPTKAQAETCTARESLNLELSSAVHLLSVAMWDTCGQAQFKTRIKEDLQLFLHELASRIVQVSCESEASEVCQSKLHPVPSDQANMSANLEKSRSLTNRQGIVHSP